MGGKQLQHFKDDKHVNLSILTLKEKIQAHIQTYSHF
jgi:hypothetical protein